MKNRIGIGIVGTNFISDWLCDAAKGVDGVFVSAVYSRKIDTGATFAQKHGIKNVFDDYQRMLECEQVDAVYVASPTMLHKEHTVAAIKAGKHVLCEKSLATEFSEAEEMFSEAERCGVVLLEAMRPAFDPLYAQLFDVFKSQREIVGSTLSFQKYSSRYDDFKRGIVQNAFNPDMKNSALLDIGIYPLWLAIRLFGEPTTVKAESIRLSNGFDGEGRVLLYYDFCKEYVEILYSKIRDDSASSVIRLPDTTVKIDKISEPKRIEFHSPKGTKIVESPYPCENNMIFELSAFRDFINGKRDFSEYSHVSRALMRTVDRIVKSQNGLDA